MVAIMSPHNNTYFKVHKRSAGKVLMVFRVATHQLDAAKDLLEKHNIQCEIKRKPVGYNLHFTTDKKAVQNNKELFVKIAEFASARWEK